jgi:hypothetical protein
MRRRSRSRLAARRLEAATQALNEIDDFGLTRLAGRLERHLFAFQLP